MHWIGVTLAPPGKYNGFIFAAAVMWSVATMYSPEYELLPAWSEFDHRRGARRGGDHRSDPAPFPADDGTPTPPADDQHSRQWHTQNGRGDTGERDRGSTTFFYQTLVLVYDEQMLVFRIYCEFSRIFSYFSKTIMSNKIKIRSGNNPHCCKSMSHQYFWLYTTLVAANTVTLISYTFGQLTGGKNTEIWPKVEIWGHLYRPLCHRLGSNLACKSTPTMYCFVPNFNMIGT